MRRGILLVLGVLVAAASASGAPFLHGPYSGAPSANSVILSWRSETPCAARVEYGLRSEYEATGELPLSISVPRPEDVDVTETMHVELTDLQLAQDYVYRVVLLADDAETESPLGAFSTEPLPGEPVTFAILSDTQQQLEGINRLEWVGDAIAADEAPFDFILHAGDVVESPVGPYWDGWYTSFDEMLLRASFIPVLGNHERNDRSYYDMFNLPPGAGHRDERWWALHWGDVVVVGLDTNVRRAPDYIAQQAWAAEHLSGTEPHKFVIFHHPVFSSDEYYGSGYQYDTIFHPIFVEHEVDIVFNGHSHHFEHIVRDGVTYLVVGGGGATPRFTTPIHIQGSDVSIEQHHFYVRVTASTEAIDVACVSVAEEVGGEPVRTPGVILDRFTLRPEDGRDIASPARLAMLLWVGAAVVAVALAALLLGARR